MSEPFWSIAMTLQKSREECVQFSWSRGRLFDRQICLVLFERCVEFPSATIVSVDNKPKSKWRPVPLTTVELQKLASRKIHMSSDHVMNIAERLYQNGFISYPRTETDSFENEFDFNSLIAMQTSNFDWGAHAVGLLGGRFRTPRKGKQSDKAHPPIHPTKAGENLTADEKKVYALITRHFLACCSDDAKGHETVVTAEVRDEVFSARGLVVLERNYLDVYPYDSWNAHILPTFVVGESFVPTSLEMTESHTTPPSLLSEADLISIMDKYGIGLYRELFVDQHSRVYIIGTDATIHEHIKKILDREYACKNERNLFYPTTLGVSLIEGYNSMGFDLSKPELRAQVSLRTTMFRLFLA